MNNVNRILDFIDKDETKQTPIGVEQSEVRPIATEQKESPKVVERIEETPNKPTIDDSQYKGIIRKINNNIRRNRYPCIIEIDDKNMLFNNEDELRIYSNSIKDEHRQKTKEERQRNINNYIAKNKDTLKKTNKKDYKTYDDEILTTEDNTTKIYKKGPLKAIQHEEDIIEIPKTSKKDRKKIYETIKQDKEVLKELKDSKTDDEFNIKTYEALKKADIDTSNIYKMHHDNPFNKDYTWTRNNFIQFLDEMINKEEELRQEAHKRVMRENQQKQTIQENSPYNSYITSQGINPNLMKRY